MCFTVVRSGFLHFSIQLSHRHCSISVRDSIQLSSLSSTYWTSTDSSPSFPYLPSTCLAICMPVDFISNVGSFESYPCGYKTHTHNPTPADSHLHWLLLLQSLFWWALRKKEKTQGTKSRSSRIAWLWRGWHMRLSHQRWVQLGTASAKAFVLDLQVCLKHKRKKRLL